MRAHLLKHPVASAALLSGLAFLAFGASTAQAAVVVSRGTQRGGLVNGTSGAGATAVALVALALVIVGLTWAVLSDRRPAAATQSSSGSEPRRLPGAHDDGKPDETRKAA
jgi:hypothetical protein